MKKSILSIAVLGLLATAIAIAPSQAFGQETKQGKGKKVAAAEAEKAPKKQGVFPFRGKVNAVDKTAKTVTVGERVFQVTSDTKLMKAGKPVKLDDVAVGDEVGGSYRKADDGKLVAQMIRFGPKPEAAEGAKKDGGKKEGKSKKEK
jgi:hypothetical protein